MLKDLLPERIYNILTADKDEDRLTEVRMRVNKPLTAAEYGVYSTVYGKDGYACEVSKEDVDYVLSIATKHSVYSVNSQLAGGYLSCDDGIRIGVSGEGVYKNGRLFTLKNVNSLCIRIPRQIFGCASALSHIADDFDNTVIISPPGMGKTTILREFIRILSDKGYNVVVIDERNELSASVNGISSFDLGKNTDVLLVSDKKSGYEGAVRALRPDVIATDEIFGKEEIECLADISRSGVKIVATVHAKDALSLLKDKTYRALAPFVRYYVQLEGVGKVSSIVDKERIKVC